MEALLFKKYSRDLTLLIVEDDESALALYEKRFKKFFKEIEVALNGQIALEKLKEKKFDVIMSDINMPKVNGIVLTKKIREKSFNQAIVIISSYSEVKYFIELINLGVDGFLLKPFDELQAQKLLYKICKTVFERKTLEFYHSQLESFSDSVINKDVKSHKILSVIDEFLKINPEFKDSFIKLFHQNSIELPQILMPPREEIKEIPKDVKKIEIIHIGEREKISAKEYLESIEFEKYSADILEDMELLGEVASDLYGILEVGLELNKDTLLKVGDLFEKYGSSISYFVEFKELAHYILEIGNFFKSINLDEIDNESVDLNQFKLIVSGFLVDLENWKNSIFIKQDSTDIHFWDHQIESSYKQLVSFFEEDDDDDDDDDIMLF